MEDLKPIARTVRWATASMIHNLGEIPADKLDWKPESTCKSALQVVGEVVGVMEMSKSVFAGGGFELKPHPVPANLEEATSMLQETSEAYACALESAGSELERAVETPFGPLWGTYSVTFGMVDLLHHHGQITFIQSLLGDTEHHGDMDALARYFGPPKGDG
jgi:uncharacterized damage-inducible protein DinB